MDRDTLIKFLNITALIVIMLAMGLGVRFEEVIDSIRRPRLILLGLLANFVLVPAITLARLCLFRANPMVSVGLFTLAICPGAPVGPLFTGTGRRQERRQTRRIRPLAASLLSIGLSLIAGCGKPVLTADDAVVRRNGSVLLRAYVERKINRIIRSDVKEQPVRFYLNGELAGEAQTDQDGAAVLRHGLDDATVRSYSAETTLDGHALRDERPIFRFPSERRVSIVIDIDGTVCQTSRIGAIFGRRDTRSKSFEDSAATIHKLQQTFDVAFLTGRPRIILSKTRLWVKEHEFPDIPLFSAPGLRLALKPGEFKSRIIAQAKQDFLDILIGIGDLGSDVYAYRSNGMLALIVGHGRKIETSNQVISFSTWSAIDRFFEDNQDVLTDPERLRRMLDEGSSFQVRASPE